MLRFHTIGHSNHAPDKFLGLLRAYNIQVVVDTRSSPHSKYVPHFDREALKPALTAAGIRYLFLGDAIGGRPADPASYDPQGRVLYSAVAKSPTFLEGITRLETGAQQFTVALLCGEEDPTHCHRRLLISRVLIERGAEIIHIRGDSTTQSEPELAAQSNKPLTQPQPALFAELNEAKWRSTASVSRKNPPPSSSPR